MGLKKCSDRKDITYPPDPPGLFFVMVHGISEFIHSHSMSLLLLSFFRI